MLQLARHGRSALRSPFICTSCRTLLRAAAPPRLPGAVAIISAGRHYSSENQQEQQKPAKKSEKTPEQMERLRERRKGQRARRSARKRLEANTEEQSDQNKSVTESGQHLVKEPGTEAETKLDTKPEEKAEEKLDTKPEEKAEKKQEQTPEKKPRKKPETRHEKRPKLKKKLEGKLRRKSATKSGKAAAENDPETQPENSSEQDQTRTSPGRRLGVTRTPRQQARQVTSASKLQLWRETLKVLKDIQSAPPSGGQAATTAHYARVTKTQSGEAVSRSTPPAKYDQLRGALGVLKQVLRHELEEDAPHLARTVADPVHDRKRPENAPNGGNAAVAWQPKTLAEAFSRKKPTTHGDPAVPAETKPARGRPNPISPEPASLLTAMQPMSARSGAPTKKGPQRVLAIQRINANKLELSPVEKPQPPVPRLAYGLDRVLFNPGVYQVQDPRSLVFNFDPYLARIMPVKDFDFDAIKQYVTSSKDTTLIRTAAELSKKYTGSTSSMTATLAHFHFLLSAWRRINPALMSSKFPVDSYNFTRITRAPAATFLHWRNGTYAIDADKEFDTANILSMLGKSMEKLLTLPKEEFEKYRRTNSDQLSEEERNEPEAYHYTTMGDFLMRSQLDAYDPRLPGTGMFDLKTRAVISIRMDAQDYAKGLGYEIRRRHGQWESFEREYYDMIRSAFLKYSLQVRMGRMDGIFVAFHNTERIFGFQYIPLEEMDLSLHGQDELTLGDREFKLSVHLLNKVLNKITAKYPGQSLRLHLETRGEESTPFMYIFAKPVTKPEIEQVQGAAREAIDEFERKMMGARVLGAEEGGGEGGEEAMDEADAEDIDEAEHEEVISSATWEEVMSKVDEELEDEEHGVTFVREAIESALQESGLLRTTAADDVQRYVDAFLEALTVNSRSTESEEAGSSETEEAQAVEHPGEMETEEAQAAEQPDEPGTAEAQAVEHPGGTEIEETHAVEQPGETDTEEAQAAEQLSETETADAKTSAATGASEHGVPTGELQNDTTGASSVEEPSLKDLLVKLAGQIQAIPSEQRTASDQNKHEMEEEDAVIEPRIRKIERLFSELTDQPQPQEPVEAEKDDGNRTIESGSISVEADGELAEEKNELAVEGKEGEAVQSTTPPSDAETPGSAQQTTTTTKSKRIAGKVVAQKEEAAAAHHEVYGLILTIRNKVDGQYVVRPERLRDFQSWSVEYAMEEIEPMRARRLYQMVLKRRRNALYGDDKQDRDRWYHMFQGKLERYSSLGRRFRQQEDRRQAQKPVYVYGSDEPKEFAEVFPAEAQQQQQQQQLKTTQKKKKRNGNGGNDAGNGGKENGVEEEQVQREKEEDQQFEREEVQQPEKGEEEKEEEKKK